MTPEQQIALESIVNRPLTEDEIAAIEPHLVNRNDVAIAAVLSAGRTRLMSIEVGVGTVIAVMKPNGGAFLDAVDALGQINRDVYWGMDSLRRGVFNPGLESAQGILNDLKKALPQFASELEKIKNLGRVSDPLSFNAVSAALNKAENRMTL